MANLDPWSYASKTRSEHAEQVALFMWANMARNFGPNIANDPNSYNVLNFAKTQFEGAGQLGHKIYTAPLPQLKWLHAISNHGAGFGRKAEGVKTGVADMFLPVPTKFNSNHINGIRGMSGDWYASGLYIELKRQGTETQAAGKPSPEQVEFQTDMRNDGYAHEIIYGWELARDCILRYLGCS